MRPQQSLRTDSRPSTSLLTGLALLGCANTSVITPVASPPGSTLSVHGSTGSADATGSADLDVPEPSEIHSHNGVLKATLEAAPAEVTVAGKTFTANVYNGQYVAPVLVAHRGDRVELRFVNNVGPADVFITGPQPSNVHTHGMAISPLQPADNAYILVPSANDVGKPGAPNGGGMRMPPMHDTEKLQSFPGGVGYVAPNVYEYRWTVPPQHSQGLYWYHPHAHGLVEPQVLSGMSGLLVIDGFIQEHYPWLDGVRVRRLLLKDIPLPGAADGSPLTKTINGVANGVIRMRPGEVQLWEIGHVGADAFFDLALDRHQWVVLGNDGNILEDPQQQDHVFLGPGARVALAVVAGAPGEYALRSRAVDTGPAGDPNPDVVLARVRVAGQPVQSAALVAKMSTPAVRRDEIDITLEQLQALPITNRRTVTFSETADGKTFFIDNKEFDPVRDDVTVHVGDVEEWTLINTSTERHVFHIHQLDFLVESVNDQGLDAEGLRDTIDIPPAENGVPGKVVVKMPFINPDIVGRFPYHCHILEHEDHGMMANLRVLPADTAKKP